MFSTTLVITFLIVGSVWMDSNIKELCSQKYFHSFVAKYSNGKTSLQLNREVDHNLYSEVAYHSWDLLVTDDKSGSFITTNISYALREGQTPNSSLTQPIECAINFNTSFYGSRQLSLSGFLIINDINGPKIDYRLNWFSYQVGIGTDGFKQVFEEEEDKSSSLYMSGISINGLLCKVSDKSLYAIVESKNSMNAFNRTQFVSRHRLERYKDRKLDLERKNINYSYHRMEFFFDPTYKDIIEFLGIDCPIVEKKWISTKNLVKIFWGLSISAVILAFTDLLLSIWRLKQRPTENTDAYSDVNTTTVESQETRKSHGSDMRKAIEIMADPEIFFANL